jgi:uncharacterized damage-inducible protein DinB
VARQRGGATASRISSPICTAISRSGYSQGWAACRSNAIADEEFAARPGPGSATKAELLSTFAATVARCRETIRGLSADELARVRKIQKYELDGYRALFHTVEHMSYHTGQIVLLAKLLGVALDFYPQHRGE